MSSRDQVRGYVINYFSEHFHLPLDCFSDKTSLRGDLLYNDQTLVPVGQYFNQAHWTGVYVMPKEIAACQTIGDVVDLLTKDD